VVAPHVHVGHAQRPDLVDQRRLDIGAPVGEVAGVGHHVDPELVDQAAHEVEGGRVEVDVAHVQDPDGAAGLEGGRRFPGQVEGGHVVDQVGQLGPVLAEAVEHRLDVAYGRRGAGEQAGVAG